MPAVAVPSPRASHAAELARYLANGLAATLVHFCVLTVNLKLLGIPSAGLSNLIAAFFGLTVSFLGNRYFVFRGRPGVASRQVPRFVLLYAAPAAVHGLILFLWSDLGHLHYATGFVIATAVQMVVTYLGNKFLVFR